jgi:hypothetical protein
MMGSTSNLSIDEKQVTTTKRKEEDVTAMAQGTTGTAQ